MGRHFIKQPEHELVLAQEPLIALAHYATKPCGRNGPGAEREGAAKVDEQDEPGQDELGRPPSHRKCARDAAARAVATQCVAWRAPDVHTCGGERASTLS
jgi:hypothetical protein